MFSKMLHKINKSAILLIIIILTYPIISKYTYVQHNQYEQIPLILRFIDPQFLAHDWVTNINSQFSPRFFFTFYMGSMAKLIPLPYLYLFHYLLTIAMISLATYILTRKIFRSEFTALLNTIIILYGQKMTLGGNDLVGRDLDPSRMAFAFVALGISLIFSNRLFLSAVLFSLAFYLHPLIGLEVPLLVYLSLFLMKIHLGRNSDNKAKYLGIRLVGKSLIIYLFLSGYAIIKYFLSYTNNLTDIPKELLITIITKVRLPFHYQPLSFPLIDYIKFILLLVAFIIMVKKYIPKSNIYPTQFINYFTLLSILLCIASTVFTVIYPIYSIIILQLFRLTVMVYWLSAIVVFGFFFYLYEKYRQPQNNFSVGLIIIPFLFSYPEIFTLRNKSQFIFIIAIILWSCFYHYVKSARVKNAIIILPVFFYGLFYLHYPFQFQKPFPFETAETKLSLWVKDNIPKDAIFLVPPNFYAFKLVSQRAIIADWMNGPFSEQNTPEWFARIMDISGLKQFPYEKVNENEIIEGYKKIDVERIYFLYSKYKFNNIVVDKQIDLPFPMLYQNELYTIYQFSSKTF